MKIGFINANAKQYKVKRYSYHGLQRECLIQIKPPPGKTGDIIPGDYIVLTFGTKDVDKDNATLKGVLIFVEGLKKFTLRGFEYGLTTEYGYDIWEVGQFNAGNYDMHIIRPE